VDGRNEEEEMSEETMVELLHRLNATKKDVQDLQQEVAEKEVVLQKTAEDLDAERAQRLEKESQLAQTLSDIDAVAVHGENIRKSVLEEIEKQDVPQGDTRMLGVARALTSTELTISPSDVIYTVELTFRT
jgi:hypothetical protein